MFRCLALCSLVALAVPVAAPAATYETLHTFKSMGGLDGKAFPTAPLVVDPSGSLYGVIGSTPPSAYELTPSGSRWRESTIFIFPSGSSGCEPQTPLVRNGAGDLFGLALYCWPEDPDGHGVAYELSPPKTAGAPRAGRIIYDFVENGAIGDIPCSNLTIDGQGNLFGSAEYFFRLSPPGAGSGAWRPTRISMSASCIPILDVGGAPYTGTYGKSPYEPVDFVKITETGTRWTTRTLSRIDAGNGGVGGVIMNRAGDLYGTTEEGGPSGVGSLFQMRPPPRGSTTWTVTTLHAFSGPDGALPTGVTFDRAGNLWGVTSSGGRGSGTLAAQGVIYELKRPAAKGDAWTYTIQYQPPNGFTPLDSPIPAFNGPLVVGKDGALYGTANGPAATAGSVFRITP